MMVGIMFLLLGIATSCSDGDEAILPEQASAKMPATEVVVNKDSCMQLFSQILSKAVSIRKGRGVIETSILPISDEFYTQKRF